MISWQTIQTLLMFFGPWLVPRAIAMYRSIRSRPASEIKPLPPQTSYALLVLFISALIAFASTLPYFAEENIFRLTQSRLQTPAGVLMTRLAAIRPLTAQDEKLRSVLDAGGLGANLLHTRFGPAALRDCPFIGPGEQDAGSMYLLYATPAMAAPHILHLFALGIATSGFLSGREGPRWRTMAGVAGVVLAVAEFWIIGRYDDVKNQRSTRVNEIDFIHWKMQVWRGLAIAALDALLGWVIWLQATGRAFMTPLTPAEQVANLGRMMEGTFMRARGLGVIRNSTVRTTEMRNRANDYWIKDSEVMRDVFEEPDVLQAQRNALNRLDMARISAEADQVINSFMPTLMVTPQR